MSNSSFKYEANVRRQLAEHKDWNQGEAASLAQTKSLYQHS